MPWWSWIATRSSVCPAPSRRTGPRSPSLPATRPARSSTPGSRSSAPSTVTTSPPRPPRRSPASPPGPAGISSPHIAATAPPPRVSNGSGTSPTSSAARSPWPTSRSPEAGSGRRKTRFERALELAGHESPALRGTADMYVGLSRLGLGAERPRRGQRLPAPQRRPGREGRAPAEPVPVAGRDGPDPRGRRRSRQCTGPAGCGPAGVRRRLLTECPSDRRRPRATADRPRRAVRG